MNPLAKVLPTPSSISKRHDAVLGVAYSANGKQMAFARARGNVYIRETMSKGASLQLRGHVGNVTAVDFHPDGEMLASSGTDRLVKLWDVGVGRILRVLEGHESGVTGVAFHSDARLASSSMDGTVIIWNVQTGQPLGALRGHVGGVFGVAFSPDGQHLVSAGQDGTVRFWDARSFQELRCLNTHGRAVRCVAFSPNGVRLASAGDDGNVIVWDAATGTATQTLEGHTGSITKLAFHPNSRHLASSSVDSTIRLWNAIDGRARVVFRGHRGDVHGVAIHPEGLRLASCGKDGSVRLWGLTPKVVPREPVTPIVAIEEAKKPTVFDRRPEASSRNTAKSEPTALEKTLRAELAILKRGTPRDKNPSLRTKVLFTLHGLACAIPAENVDEITCAQTAAAATPPPASPPWHRGTIQLRGASLPLLDMAQLISVSADASPRKHWIVVRNSPTASPRVLLVDRVQGLFTLPDDGWPVPAQLAKGRPFIRVLSEHQDNPLLILDLDHLPTDARHSKEHS